AAAWLLLAINLPTLADEQRPLSDEALVKYCLREVGDVESGRTLFQSDRLGCSSCHPVDTPHGRVGPSLIYAGDKLTRREIIRSILEPSANLAVGYEQTAIELSSGQTRVGIVKQDDGQACELLDASGNLWRVPFAEIEERRTLLTSAMPTGVQRLLTASELNDLVEYVVSLKQPDQAELAKRGMPSEISRTAQQLTFAPLLPDELRFDKPVWAVPIPTASQDNATRSRHFLVVEHQTKRIWNLVTDDDLSATRKTLFADLGPGIPGEGRLACLAFHPDFRHNRKYYIYDRERSGNSLDIVVSQRLASADLATDSQTASHELLRVRQSTLNHFGGWLGFGPDGYLYVAIGDSGPQEDPHGNAQSTERLLGKILRIDVNRREAPRAYAIPPDNPFLNGEFPPEVWAAGFREPWRASFDRVTNDFWIGDVGQDRFEEVMIVRRGENHGWNVYEGFAPFSFEYRREQTDYQPPLFAYGRRYGVSITGGYVYRPTRRPTGALVGKYICGDYESRNVFALGQHNRQLTQCHLIGVAPERIVSFAEDLAGELYIVGYEGMIYRLQNLTEIKF
ncbi:MAG: PQQ-dependent sugar dehydrogenase, partial [Planctomycetales bacterium]|nr:PQQ-dependent sugar dehydrogenase [Planctomycetales bacterium]